MRVVDAGALEILEDTILILDGLESPDVDPVPLPGLALFRALARIKPTLSECGRGFRSASEIGKGPE